MVTKNYRNQINVTRRFVAFWGSPLSNFFHADIKYEGMKFHCSEQLFMYFKAREFGDEESMKMILNAATPEECKKLGRKVKGFTDEVWDKVKEDRMLTAVRCKFRQNKDLRDYLFSEEFEGRQFVEGSPFDRVWGVGVIFDSRDISNEKKWVGQNLLGKILDTVKKEISEEKEQSDEQTETGR